MTFNIGLINVITKKHNCIYCTTDPVKISHMFRPKGPIIRIYIKIKKLKNVFIKMSCGNVEFNIVIWIRQQVFIEYRAMNELMNIQTLITTRSKRTS